MWILPGLIVDVALFLSATQRERRICYEEGSVPAATQPQLARALPALVPRRVPLGWLDAAAVALPGTDSCARPNPAGLANMDDTGSNEADERNLKRKCCPPPQVSGFAPSHGEQDPNVNPSTVRFLDLGPSTADSVPDSCFA
jgi:hypothetical protein